MNDIAYMNSLHNFPILQVHELVNESICGTWF